MRRLLIIIAVLIGLTGIGVYAWYNSPTMTTDSSGTMWLEEMDVAAVVEATPLDLVDDSEVDPSEYAINEIVPTVYGYNGSSGNLWIYIFATIDERDSAVTVDAITELFPNLAVQTLQTKNAYIINSNPIADELLDYAINSTMNGRKSQVITATSANWQAQVNLESYNNAYTDEAGIVYPDTYLKRSYKIRYLGDDLENVASARLVFNTIAGEFDYEGSLISNSFSDLGSMATYQSDFSFDDLGTVTIEWNGTSETLEFELQQQ